MKVPRESTGVTTHFAPSHLLRMRMKQAHPTQLCTMLGEAGAAPPSLLSQHQTHHPRCNHQPCLRVRPWVSSAQAQRQAAVAASGPWWTRDIGHFHLYQQTRSDNHLCSLRRQCKPTRHLSSFFPKRMSLMCPSHGTTASCRARYRVCECACV